MSCTTWANKGDGPCTSRMPLLKTRSSFLPPTQMLSLFEIRWEHSADLYFPSHCMLHCVHLERRVCMSLHRLKKTVRRLPWRCSTKCLNFWKPVIDMPFCCVDQPVLNSSFLCECTSTTTISQGVIWPFLTRRIQPRKGGEKFLPGNSFLLMTSESVPFSISSCAFMYACHSDNMIFD